MATVAAQVAGTTLLIEGSDVAAPSDWPREAPAAGGSSTYGTETTGIKPRAVTDAYAQLKDVLTAVAGDLGSTLEALAATGPTGAEVSFGLTFSTEANVWVMRTGGDIALNVTLTWSKTSQR